MWIIPAIDLQQGKCVRLSQGKANQSTTYSSDPLAVALEFQKQGAPRLHLVDLDAAFHGTSQNQEIIETLIKELSIPVQLGGGIRSLEQIGTYLEKGVASVIVGTLAVRQPDILQQALKAFPGEQILLGVDAKDNQVAIHGWETVTQQNATDFISYWKDFGVERVIFTDIARDGMLTGPNVEALRHIAQATQVRLTASGGVSCLADVHELESLESLGIDQVIVGKAIYEGTLSLTEVYHAR